MSRRRFLETTGKGIATLTLSTVLSQHGFSAPDSRIKGIGACDWSIGRAADPSTLGNVDKAGLDAVQVSVGRNPGSVPLRKERVREQYRELCEKYDLTISSVAAGGILNSNPLFSEPQSAVFVVDAIEAAGALGVGNVLLAFFGAADLRRRNDDGEFIDQKDGKYSSYALNETAVNRVVDVLRQVAPRAENAGVEIGLENTLTARQNVDIIEDVGSSAVQVYYDMGNATHYGYNVTEEIRYLGNERICEVHIKDRQENRNLTKQGAVDLHATAEALHDVDYDGWLVLETGGGISNFRKNGEYARNVFNVS